MRLSTLAVALLHTITACAAAPSLPADTCGTDDLARRALANVRLRATRQLPDHHLFSHTGNKSKAPQRGQDCECTWETASVRREWDTLSPADKQAYIDALLCLQSKPSISGHLVPGARSRYDDFVGTHINQTLSIHGTGNFLAWHRYFTWTLEHALRQECAFQGTMPYFNWGRYAADMSKAPLLDGSALSLSGNGAHDPRDNGTFIPSPALPFIKLPPGAGGGCVTSGPFTNWTVNLGPLSPILSYLPPNPSPDGLGYNPRCLRRDIGVYAASIWLPDANTTALITQSPTIGPFQTTLQGDFAAGFLGAHTAGHFVVGGDPGGDIFTSPGDPFFWHQHAQVDRVWWIWQNYRPGSWAYNGREGNPHDRIYVVANTTTVNNVPPSRNTSLDDRVNLGVNDNFGIGKGADGKGYKIRELVDTMKGPFCYYYV